MNARRTSQLLVLLVGLFGVLAFVCQCAHEPASNFPNGPTLEDWMRAGGIPFRVTPFINHEEETEFPKLSEP